MTKIPTKKRGRGRPPKPEAERKRNNVTVRLRDATRAALEKWAKENQRSLSEEIETRLERSALDQGQLAAAMEATYGRWLAGLLQVIGAAAQDAGRTAGLMSTMSAAISPAGTNWQAGVEGFHTWQTNPFGFNEAAVAISAVVEEFRPADAVVAPPGDLTASSGEPSNIGVVGKGMAIRRIVAINQYDPESADGAWAKPIREQLGLKPGQRTPREQAMYDRVSRKGKAR